MHAWQEREGKERKRLGNVVLETSMKDERMAIQTDFMLKFVMRVEMHI